MFAIFRTSKKFRISFYCSKIILLGFVAWGYSEIVQSGSENLYAQQRDGWRDRDQNRRNNNRWERSDQGRDRDRQRNRRESAEATLIRRMDINRDGSLDPSEMSGRMEGYLKGLGFDTSRRIRVETILSRIQEQESLGGAEEADSRVPTFGAINQPVLNFGNIPENSLETQFSQEIMDRVDRMLARYDRNRDGYIDQEEAAQVNWGSPTYQQSDSNGDGRLSRWELANRYRARDELRQARREEASSDDLSRRTTDPNFRGIFNSLPFTGQSSSETIDQDERGSRTDRNNRQSSDSENGESSNFSRGAKRSDETESVDSPRIRRQSRQSRTKQQSFEELDIDGNGMIEMHEFADQWDEETIEKFYQLDLNGDGIITQREWQEAELSRSNESDKSS